MRRQRVRVILALAAFGMLVLCGCARHKKVAARIVPPLLLAQLALGPGDLDGVYSVASDQYVDEDGAPVSMPTHEFERRFTVRPATADAPEKTPAVGILITLGDKGSDQAEEFVTAADDEDVGPANVGDDLRQQVPDAHDVHVDLLQDFDIIADGTAAFHLSWLQGAGADERGWRGYRVYVRAGGMLVLVALRGQADPAGAEPDGLRHQVETIAHKQIEKLKLKNALAPVRLRPSQVGPRWPRASRAFLASPLRRALAADRLPHSARMCAA